jgi:hypothetical protein
MLDYLDLSNQVLSLFLYLFGGFNNTLIINTTMHLSVHYFFVNVSFVDMFFKFFHLLLGGFKQNPRNERYYESNVD